MKPDKQILEEAHRLEWRAKMFYAANAGFYSVWWLPQEEVDKGYAGAPKYLGHSVNSDHLKAALRKSADCYPAEAVASVADGLLSEWFDNVRWACNHFVQGDMGKEPQFPQYPTLSKLH